MMKSLKKECGDKRRSVLKGRNRIAIAQALRIAQFYIPKYIDHQESNYYQAAKYRMAFTYWEGKQY